MHLWVSEQYIDPITHGATTKVKKCRTEFWQKVENMEDLQNETAVTASKNPWERGLRKWAEIYTRKRYVYCTVNETASFAERLTTSFVALPVFSYTKWLYEGNSISKLQIVIEKNRMEIMTYKQHLFFNIISIQI